MADTMMRFQSNHIVVAPGINKKLTPASCESVQTMTSFYRVQNFAEKWFWHVMVSFMPESFFGS
jgi:hypothetical protein